MAKDPVSDKKKPTPLLWHLAKLTFSTPAAIALLGEVEKLRGFGDQLERIILGYNRVSQAIWEAVGLALPFTIPASHGALTLLVLLTVAVVIERHMGPANPVQAEFGDKENFLAAYILAAAVLGIALLADTFFLSVGIAAGVISLLFVVLIPALVVPKLRTRECLREEWWMLVLFPFSLYAVYAIFSGTIDAIRETGLVAVGDLIITLACALLVIRYQPLSVIYVVFWAGGIFLVDFLASDVLPRLEEWLTAIGV